MDGSHERRTLDRCPICQGPTKEDPKAENGMRCRSSVCAYNHQHIKCPRCQQKDFSSISYAGENFNYVCADCQMKWTA